MQCSEFRDLYSKYTNFPVPREVWDTEEGEQWQRHLVYCRACSDWHQQQEVEKRGASVSDYPCVHMAYHATFNCEKHINLYQCSDAPILYKEKWDEYSLGPRGGRGDEYVIYSCPWCGVNLPESKRNLWLDRLEELGIDPWTDDVPKEYETNAWRSKSAQ
jgi:hypothetical protein